MNLFKSFWKTSKDQLFEKNMALTVSELTGVQDKIARLQAKGLPSSRIIDALQRFNPKLSDRYRAEAAYWTEVKRIDTEEVAELGDELGISKYKVVLSPSACRLCREKTNNGNKIFSQKEVQKTGYGQFVPWHPNCYCVAIPYE